VFTSVVIYSVVSCNNLYLKTTTRLSNRILLFSERIKLSVREANHIWPECKVCEQCAFDSKINRPQVK
jgi:hypothetical protein